MDAALPEKPGICQTSLYKYHKDETRIKNIFRLQLEVFARKNWTSQSIPLAWSQELPPDGIFKNTPERPTTWGSGTLAAAADLSPTTSGRLQRNWPQKGDFCHRLQRNMAAGEVV
ncbi:betaine-homocysteine methyltransferase 2, isoform CRA_b [Mus musculus]|nr:betaine-homocysteine methyltransferase 2, isoform CRA_b [Mus musculus]